VRSAVLVIKQNSASFEELLRFYEETTSLFIPNLYELVESLNDYVDKLHKNAILLEAYNDNTLVGIVAMYLNDYKTKIAFISSVIVSAEYQGKGIAKSLLESVIEMAVSKRFLKIKLEVSKENAKAIKLYNKLGFENSKNGEDAMELIL